MRDKLKKGRTKIFIILASFVVVLGIVGVLMEAKLQTLLQDYAQNQMTQQAKALADLAEEIFNAELQNLENIAWYIESETADVDALLSMADKDGVKVNWGVLELGGHAVHGEPLQVVDFSGIQESFRGNKAISYKKGIGLLFTVPIYHNGNVKYVLYKLVEEELLRQKYGMTCYNEMGRVLIATNNELIVVPFKDWKDEDLDFFAKEEVLQTFSVINEQMNISTAACALYKEKENSQYLFVAELQDYDFVVVGSVPQKLAEEGLFYVLTLILWVFGLLLLLLAIGMAFLFGAEEKARESDELRQAKLIADSANKAKSDFLASMSHEIRTPINAVMGMNEMILRECQDEEIKEYAVNIQSASKTLLSLINDILDLSKIEAGKMEIVEDNYTLSGVLNDVVNMIQVKAKQKNIAFHMKIDEGLPDKLYGDEVRIRQVMVNILNNAVKYTKEGSVTLHVEKEMMSEGSLLMKISVVDTGIGIRKEDMAKLFGSFERLDLKENRKVEGTGLGLAITSKMVTLMKGRMEVESEYGEGSTFTIFLPQKVMGMECIGNFEDRFREYVQSLKVYTESFVAPDGNVLIVDDNEMNLFVAEKLLKKTKLQITCCNSGEKALELVCKKHFDIILLDHMMPEMDGIETLKRINALENSLCKDTPTIALTANAILGVREMYLAEGFDDYLSKPIVAEKLEELLRKYLPQKKIQSAENDSVALKPAQVEEKIYPAKKSQADAGTETIKAETKRVETLRKDVGTLWDKMNRLTGNLIKEDMDIQHKLLNLILMAAFVGGIVSLLISILLGFSMGAIIVTGVLIAVVGASLWIANGKKKPQLAALILTLVANTVIFPVMYFANGGMYSGMPIWMVLGMIFSWLILKGSLCFIVYSLNVIAIMACILAEMLHPEWVIPIEGNAAAYVDLIQSMIIVTCIFGLIFKYQTYVYEKQKKQIMSANKAKSDFLTNMSHEIRTPINAILGYNEMIIKESRESQTAEYALNVQSAGRTLLSLVNDILDFTDLERKDLLLRKEPYSMPEVLQDIFSYAEYNTEKKGLELRIAVDEQIPQRLLGDAMRLTQIMDNLISNGVKYTNEGYVEVALHWKQETDNRGNLIVCVKDSGIGMKQEDVQKISQSFIRFDNQQTRNIQGIGLGLTIVTRLLHFMGSSLQVESEFGKGSTFSFQLSQDIVDASPIGKYQRVNSFSLIEAIENEKFEAPDVKVLVVDDNMMNLDLLKGMLRSTRMQIDTGVNGQEALEMMRKKSYHMILMDHMMPVMDGVEALQRMKEEKLCENVPVIVLTANAVGDAREEYLKVGFRDYLSKPIQSRLLLAMIKKYLPKELVETKACNEAAIVQETEAVMEAKDAENSKNTEKSFLERISFLDTATGMEYCCNSEEFYREMVGSYLSTNKYEEICKNYREESWDKYRILVHALKSTSLSIGATAVSEDAKALEMAAKEGRIADVQANHDRVMAEYKKLLEKIKNVLENKDLETETAVEIRNETENAVTMDAWPANLKTVQEHILVVDDDPMNLHVAEKLLKEMFRVDCAKSGAEALQFLEKEIPNLILLDLHMPEMDGFEVNRRMKQDKYLSEIPVIFLTADNDRDTEVKGFNEGALDFITKPFIADIMLQRVKRILELDRLQKNLQSEVKKQTQSAEARREKVERLSLQIMLTLANTIDAKDKYTNGHSLRVAEYAREIARRAGKTVQEQEDIYYIGLLHDIGKIGIPSHIINKTSHLTDEEYATIKSHPQIGADILANMTEIPGLSIGARWHHEMYNGKGYPDGLLGEEIPEIARIICVADAYDAMASKRSYRDVLPQSVIKEEIRKEMGTQFDPVFAMIMLEMMDEDREYRMRE